MITKTRGLETGEQPGTAARGLQYRYRESRKGQRSSESPLAVRAMGAEGRRWRFSPMLYEEGRNLLFLFDGIKC